MILVHESSAIENMQLAFTCQAYHGYVMWCHNLNLGLVTKARTCKSVGQKGSPGGTSYTLENVGDCERMNPHTPK
jgi:hypothetical protein